jgi:2-methylaconitate cis-trans-isomerase PrpF
MLSTYRRQGACRSIITATGTTSSSARTSLRMDQGSKLSFWRGGTSKGLFFRNCDLEKAVTAGSLSADNEDFDGRRHGSRTEQSASRQGQRWITRHEDLRRVLPQLMGSPDPYERQLNGMGGGISSLSKAVVVSKIEKSPNPAPPNSKQNPSGSREEADLEYTFVQVGITDTSIDMSGNCGNLTSAVAPFALSHGLLTLPENSQHIDTSSAPLKLTSVGRTPHIAQAASVQLWNTNTNKLIRSTFLVSKPVEEHAADWHYEPRGQYTMPGVPGPASEIRLEWRDPGGSRTVSALPTGNAVDTLVLDDGRQVEASLIDVANPGIFVRGQDVGWQRLANAVDLDVTLEVMATLERVRRKGAEMMGLDPDVQAVPKVVMVWSPADSGEGGKRDVDSQTVSMRKAHKAVPGTLAMGLGAAVLMEGTVPNLVARRSRRDSGKAEVVEEKVVVGHPTGTAEVNAKVVGGRYVEYVGLSRTARCLMEGVAFPVPQEVQVEVASGHIDS